MFRVSVYTLVRDFLQNHRSADATLRGAYYIYWTKPRSNGSPYKSQIRVMRPGMGCVKFTMTVVYEGVLGHLKEYVTSIGLLTSQPDPDNLEGIPFYQIEQLLLYGDLTNVCLVITPVEKQEGV